MKKPIKRYGIIKFDLLDPYEREDFQTALDADKWRDVAEEMDLYLRAEIKYKDKHSLQEIRDKLNELISERDLFT